MTKERAKELLPIIQAFAEGKKIQVNNYNEWYTVDSPEWNDNYNYRIKPEEADNNIQGGINNLIEMVKSSKTLYSMYDTMIPQLVDTIKDMIQNKEIVSSPIQTLSHKDIMRMWWRPKGDVNNFSRWQRIISYWGYNKTYRLSDYERTMTAEELLKNWEYAEVPPEEGE